MLGSEDQQRPIYQCKFSARVSQHQVMKKFACCLKVGLLLVVNVALGKFGDGVGWLVYDDPVHHCVARPEFIYQPSQRSNTQPVSRDRACPLPGNSGLAEKWQMQDLPGYSIFMLQGKTY